MIDDITGPWSDKDKEKNKFLNPIFSGVCLLWPRKGDLCCKPNHEG